MTFIAEHPQSTSYDHFDRPAEPTPVTLPLPSSTRAGWWAQARCFDGAATLTGLFFSEDLLDIARAKAICSNCTVRAACLDAAVERAEPWGVWGGELFANGHVVVHKRRRGRPPKHPRPEPVVDELGNISYVAATA